MKVKKNPKTHLSAKERIAQIKAVVPPVAARFKKPTLQQQTEEALLNVPRITNETVAEHREEVLKGARRFKYPLEHSKHKIVVVSAGLLITALVAFFVAITINLYRLQSTTEFTYRVTQIVPFPVAKVGKHYVSYESYLFELRRYMHYYRTQQQVDFSTDSGKVQLARYKPRALQKVVEGVYVKELAQKNGISVSDAEVRDALSMLRAQNRLSSDKDLASVIQRFYDWSIDDLRRQLKQELLEQKVAAALDEETAAKANDVLKQIQAGGDFATLAGQHSSDQATKGNGGQYGDAAITVGSQEVSPVIIRELSRLKPGEVSPVIMTPTSYEIVKLLEVDGSGKYKAAHIELRFKEISTYLAAEAAKTKVKTYITIPAPDEDVAPIPGQQPE